ncbi:NUDIX hydrolase [Psychromonas sp. CNPT3]|uniref:NUDIX hydrolase n=1 Tax=Psychromonas sp. CNPT3 TaxID=314282 RepID=UPI00006E76D6|nr:NUDIX domain-containing protein [Psychromonas sp. CNPT3]AGH81645.1 NUDIX hydrolase [Psychromonas sp. CNPT3]
MKKEIDKLAWLYIQDGKLLIARSKNKKLFYIPGGKREEGESDEQALIREIKEEISVDLIPSTIKYAATFKAQADGKESEIMVKITCYYADFQGSLSPDAEIEEIDFIGYQDKSRCSLCAIQAMDWLKSKNLIT